MADLSDYQSGELPHRHHSDDGFVKPIIKGAWNVNKRTITFESIIETSAKGSAHKKELDDHLLEIRRLVEGLKINTVKITTSVEIK